MSIFNILNTAFGSTCSQLGICTPPLLTSEHTVILFFSCLGTGLLLSLTPCVLPMVPVVSSVIIGKNKSNHLNKPMSIKRGFILSLIYVLGMSSAYAVVGGLVAKGGAHIQLWMQQPWVLISFGIFLIFMSGYLFIPAFINLSWLTKQMAISGRIVRPILRFSEQWRYRLILMQKNGSYVGVFALGAISILVLSPCVTPAMVGILSLIGRRGDGLLGMLLLFAVGLGMGGPLLLVGLSAGKWLPRAGAWMVWIQRFFGIALLAMALMLIKTALFSEQEQASVYSLSELTEQIKLAQKKHLPVILDFYADWCTSCRKLASQWKKDPSWNLLKQKSYWITVDISHMNDEADELLTTYQVLGPPTVLIFDKNGVPKQRLVGMVSVKKIINGVGLN